MDIAAAQHGPLRGAHSFGVQDIGCARWPAKTRIVLILIGAVSIGCRHRECRYFRRRGARGQVVSETPNSGREIVEVFLQEASEHLQFLREYSGILQDPYPVTEDIERLFISAHTLGGTSASYGFPLFAEVSGKLAHIFQYAMNAAIAAEASGPLVEFISEAVAVLESDLLMISANGVEALEDIGAFKLKYPFAFQQPVEPPASAAPSADAGPVLTPAGRR